MNAASGDDSDSLMRRAESAFASGRPTEAEAIWQHLLTLDPDHPEALFHLGNRCRERGENAAAIAHYEQVVALPIPDKLPMPLLVHRHQGEPCPRCGTTLEAVHFKDYVMTYCPKEQTGGRVLKDRRLSRLLK